jgi:hypothetical protein
MTTQTVATSVPAARQVAAPQWLTAALHAFALLTAVVCLYSMRRADPDLWGYLASGRLFVEGGGLTTHDPFAYTSGGFEWVTFEYGAHIVLWLAYKFAGPFGLIALKCLVGGVALCFLGVAVRVATDDPHVGVPVFVLCASTVARFFLFRPQLFTFAFFAVFVAVLFRHVVQGRAWLWVLPLVMLVWANVHGGFVAGLGAIGLTIVLRASKNLPLERRSAVELMKGTRALWITLAACVGVTFVNPMGARLWTYVLAELLHNTNRRYTVEWGPASLQTDAWSAVALTLVASVFLAVSWFACRQAKRSELPQRLCWVMTGLPLVVMAFVSVRHVPLAAIWLAPVIARLASREIESPVFRRVWFVLRGLSVLPACLTIAFVLSQPQPVVSADAGVLGSRNPCQAVAFMRTNGLAGNMFGPLWWGSYVTWNLYPAIRVSMDGRNISLFPDRMVVENFDFFLKDARSVDVDAPLRYDTDFLLIPTDSPVLSRIETDRRWRQGFRDGDAALFLRSDVPRPAPFVLPASPCSGVLR